MSLNVYEVRKTLSVEEKLRLAISYFEKVQNDMKKIDIIVKEWRKKTNRWWYILFGSGLDITDEVETLFKDNVFESNFFIFLNQEDLLKMGRYSRFKYQDCFEKMEWNYNFMMQHVSKDNTSGTELEYDESLIFSFLIEFGAFEWNGWNDKELQKQVINKLLTNNK